MSQQLCLDRFEEWLIHHKAEEMIGKAGITRFHLDDIKQDLRADVIERLPMLDLEKSCRHTFVAMVVEHRIASIIEHRTTAKRDHRHEGYSLNEAIRDSEGRPTERHQTMADERPGRSDQETFDLAADIRSVVSALPALLQKLCLLLLEGKTLAQAARELGVPRTTLYGHIQQLKAAFQKSGLDTYFQES